MEFFTHPEFDSHEQVVLFSDKTTGLRAIIAVHNTNLGPALGGCRMWNYASDAEALTDVLRLSRGMTYKAAITGLPLGGGKSVIIGDAKKDKNPRMMQAMGRMVEKLNGNYIIAEDVNTTDDDMVNININTSHVVGLPVSGKGTAGGNPSPMTALGVFTGLKTALKFRTGKTDLTGVRVAVQGLGNVGFNLCERLHEEGAVLTVTDIDIDRIQKAVDQFGATAVGLDEIYDAEAEVFAPCALGGVINDATLPRLKAVVIAGAANNQLERAEHGAAVRERNILYAPDYVINAGGLINVYYEYLARITKGVQGREEDSVKHILSIRETLDEIFTRAQRENLSTADAADRVAEGRFLFPNNGWDKAA
ncbi:MAG: Glu/Leu/Phe/Val dehydrogenase [Micavibrio sp.]|nr:MAG: Glu/Leu/Phe/Val dehydrogenase [Micavibrio sp.]